MHLKSFLLGCAALLPATLAQLTPPANFLLQARTIKGVSANNQFNKQYLIVETTNKGNAVPLFTRVNGYAEFFVLSNPDATSNGTFYTLETNSAYSAASLATMEYNADPFARFEPVMFETLAKGAAPSKQQIGFYIGGTKTDMELLWTDKYNKPTAGDFSGWLSE